MKGIKKVSKNIKVLITGGSGLLGKSIIESAGDNCELAATYVGEYDIPSSNRVVYYKSDVQDEKKNKDVFLSFKPDVVVHTASIGSPDFAEKNKDITWKINVDGTQKMVDLCRAFDSKFIYISSNGIYDGDNAPYGENDIAMPINYYGMTKLEGEIITKRSRIVSAIVRPILMYGWNHRFERQNIVTLALSKLKKKEKMSVYDDVFSNPLFSDSCAEAIWKIIVEDKYGDYNIAGSERVSICGLVKKFAEGFGLNPDLIIPVKEGYFNELVKRPIDTSYRTDKMAAILKVMPLSLTEGILKMKETQAIES